MNRWPRVRLAIAHGHSQLPKVPVLGGRNGLALLHLSHAENRVRFFRPGVEFTNGGGIVAALADV
jgi:hypothetical protein